MAPPSGERHRSQPRRLRAERRRPMIGFLIFAAIFALWIELHC
jgi:hypothetical protein